MIKSKIFNLFFISKLLFTIMLYELVIGGSGHFTELGPLTFRMLFFFTALFLTSISYINGAKINKDVFFIVLTFTLLLSFSAVVGVMNQSESSLIFEDIKPLIFFYILIFFSIVVKDIQAIYSVVKIIKIGSIIMASIYFIVIILLLTEQIDFLSLYRQQEEVGEVLFRNETLFFYKGFIYLCIGFFFFLLSRGKKSKIGALFLFASIVLTLTRGFILFTILIFCYYIFFINKKKSLKVITFTSCIFVFIYALPILFDALGDKSESNNMRFIQVDEVINDINPVSLLIGHGFGNGTESRKIHMELSFLEIFHKQGILGILLWFSFFMYMFFMYSKIKYKKYRDIALPFLLSVIFVILQSATNPYMNNPIGLTIILISFVVFSKLVELQKKLIV